jgi:hypothetical protein
MRKVFHETRSVVFIFIYRKVQSAWFGLVNLRCQGKHDTDGDLLVYYVQIQKINLLVV